MIPDNDLFSNNATLSTLSTSNISNNNSISIKNSSNGINCYKTFKPSSSSSSIGIMTLIDGNFHNGIFFIDLFGVIEFKNGIKLPPIIILKINNTISNSNNNNNNNNNNTINNNGKRLLTTAFGNIEPFFPNCYTQDTIPHIFIMTIVMDWSAVGSNTRNALAQLNTQMNFGKLIWFEQLNIRIQVNRVIYGNQNDPYPLGRGGNVCGTASTEFSEMGLWMSSNSQNLESAFTLLVSNCFSGIIGTSNQGSACSRTRGYGVSLFQFVTMFHELGHGVGMLHSFQNGIGTTGGIMDYGGGVYNGVIQYNPSNRDQICLFLNGLLTRNSCPYFYPTQILSSCGDGFLSLDEECECIDNQSQLNCGLCRNCQIDQSIRNTIECSSSLFLFRSPSTPRRIITVELSALDNSNCCINYRSSSPKTVCNNGLDACGPNGKCINACRGYLGPTIRNCGFDSQGCNLGCIFQDVCRFDIIGMNGQRISNLPDNTPCITNNNQHGICVLNGCQINGGIIVPNPPTSPPTYPPLTWHQIQEFHGIHHHFQLHFHQEENKLNFQIQMEEEVEEEEIEEI